MTHGNKLRGKESIGLCHGAIHTPRPIGLISQALGYGSVLASVALTANEGRYGIGSMVCAYALPAFVTCPV